MESWNGRVALVTGASVGIGAGICRELVRHGMTVVGVARDVQKIQDLATEAEMKLSPGKLLGLKCDLAQESDILAVFDEIRKKFGRIDVCINNAGFSTDSPLLTGQTSSWRSMLELNILALCVCTREAFKLMRENSIDDGRIIHINSVCGHHILGADMKGLNFYCGMKFMVRALTEGLRKELTSANTHIRVSSISPGLVETEFLERTFGKLTAQAWYSSLQSLQPKDIADAVVYILQSPPHVDVNEIIVQPTESAV